MADIFVSYTSSDRDWAFWIGQQLEKLGHTAHVHEWEIAGGGDIAKWMVERHDKADHILLVMSETYFVKPYSGWEWRAAQWAAQTDRPNFGLPVRIEDCKLPSLVASVKHCDLFGIDEEEARARLIEFLKPAVKPTDPVPFPGAKKDPVSGGTLLPRVAVAFPGQTESRQKEKTAAISNIPINVPRHFLGRDDDIAAIDNALRSSAGRAAVMTLHGLRGVGKTTLAVAYAERHRGDYRATWWIRAETIPTMRADLVGLGVRLGWVASDEKEEPALTAIMERLRHEGDGILLLYDNANNVDQIGPYIPRGGATHIIVTSNAPNWRSIAEPVEIEVWPNDVGAEYLIERTGRDNERDAALALSYTLGGLPLAHEQAAAYCEQQGVSLAEYAKRFVAGLTEDDEAKLKPASIAARDFFLSYSVTDDSTARRVVAALERGGYSVFAQFKDIPVGANFVEEMKRGLRSPRLVGLLSPAYEVSKHCQAEWNAAYAGDPDGSKRKLIPLLIEPTELNFLARQIVYANLVGLSGAAFDQRVLDAVRAPTPAPAPVNNVVSPVRHGWNAAAKLTVEHSALPRPEFGRSPQELSKQLATARKLAKRLADQSASPQFNHSKHYSSQLFAYLDDLPRSETDGNIYLSDAAARTLREMFAAEADVLSVPFAASLKIFLECHVGMRAYYPELSEFYASVRDGTLVAPLSLDAVERVRAVIDAYTPDQFDPSVGKELAKEEASAPTFISEHDTPQTSSSAPQPPPDPIGNVDRAQSRDQLIARSLNGLWSAFLKGKDIVPNIEGWRRAYESLEPTIRPVLDYLRQTLGS